MSGRPSFRPATREDIEAFQPGLKQTVRAYAIEIDGKTLGVGGVYYEGPNAVVFSKYLPELDKYPKAKLLGIRKILEIVGDRPCFAVADEKFPGAPKLLERLGFKHVEGRIYRWVTSSATR